MVYCNIQIKYFHKYICRYTGTQQLAINTVQRQRNKGCGREQASILVCTVTFKGYETAGLAFEGYQGLPLYIMRETTR